MHNWADLAFCSLGKLGKNLCGAVMDDILVIYNIHNAVINCV